MSNNGESTFAQWIQVAALLVTIVGGIFGYFLIQRKLVSLDAQLKTADVQLNYYRLKPVGWRRS